MPAAVSSSRFLRPGEFTNVWRLCQHASRQPVRSGGADAMMRAATITLAAILTTSATFGGCLGGEATKAGIYMLHSAAQGTCPALDWHVVLKVDGTVAGMISWDEMRSMAQVIGVVKNEDRTFHLQ